MSKQRKKHTSRRISRRRHILRLIGIGCLFCVGVIAFIVVIMQASVNTFGQSIHSADPCIELTHTDQNSTLWVSVRTTASADVMAAVKCTTMFQNATQGNDLIARAMRTGHLGDPLLVRPYRSDVGMDALWMVPVLDRQQYALALLTFNYNEGAHQLSAREFAAVTGNMFYTTHPFPYMDAGIAIATLANQKHISLASARVPELIYFPGNDQSVTDWRGGGTSYLDPIWRIPGSDGRWHYLGHDNQVYAGSALPLALGAPSAPSTLNTN